MSAGRGWLRCVFFMMSNHCIMCDDRNEFVEMVFLYLLPGITTELLQVG
jgi:hypothetical protein